jgi:hypothetical protein
MPRKSDIPHEFGQQPSWVEGDALQYTVVETSRGFLYVVLVPRTGKLLYDVRALARTHAEAEAALRQSLGDEAGGDGQYADLLVYVPPEKMLGMMMTVVILNESPDHINGLED